MKTSEVLYRAADLIEERGWVQGEGWNRNGTGSLCLEGGIIAALGIADQWDGFYACPAYAAVADYLGRNPQPAIAPIQDALWAWNDEPLRTVADVIEVLRATALIESAKEEHRPEFTLDDLHTIAAKYDGEVISDADGDWLVEVNINGTPVVCHARAIGASS